MSLDGDLREERAEESATEPSVSADEMRRVRGRFPAGVTVVTVRTDEGLRGLTVGSFAVASVSPPLVLVCLEHGLESEGLLAEAGAFGVSVLSDHQELLSERFAGRAFLVDDAFTGLPYNTRVTGAPLLDGAVAWFDCRLHARYDAGDHTMFLGRVVAAAEPEHVPLPLLYYARHYATLDRLRRP
ncbi:MAG: flavin reductase family protein [Chloroflexota bacterium]